jgi:hypothetical protein
MLGLVAVKNSWMLRFDAVGFDEKLFGGPLRKFVGATICPPNPISLRVEIVVPRGETLSVTSTLSGALL